MSGRETSTLDRSCPSCGADLVESPAEDMAVECPDCHYLEAEATPHLDPKRGLWIPPRFREFGQGIVFRTPKGTVQHFSPGDLDPFYGLVTESDFGEPEEFHDCRNPELAPSKVSIKPYGEEPQVFDLGDIGQDRHGGDL